MSSSMGKNSPYWFHAKRYGWGWGLPARREGWWVLGSVVALSIGGSIVLLATGNSFWLLFWILGLAGSYFVICWWKGEPPRWRWGED
ncbi:MAG: hypothetical protein SF172_18675 [Burkholderiales bacterium]|nr:hypothetical protein [Burkholderiales bacterium]